MKRTLISAIALAAFGTAAMTLVGQGLGAGRPAEAARSGWTAFLIGGGLMCFMGLVFFCLARPMFELFCPYPWQEPIVETGVPVLRLVAFATPAMACAIIFTSALRGAGDTRVPVLFTWVGFLAIRIPLAYLLTRDALDLGPLGTVPGWDLGLFGAWVAMSVDLFVRGGLFLWRFAGVRPEAIAILPPGRSDGPNSFPARIRSVLYRGWTRELLLALDSGDVLKAVEVLAAGSQAALPADGAVTAAWPPEACHLLEGD